MARVYGICYTLHDYTPAQVLNIQGAIGKCGIAYICFGRETCPSTGRKHLQGYLQSTQKKFDRMKTAFATPTMHLEAAKGSDQQNYNYCSKDGDVWETGRRESLAAVKKGQRSDVEAVKKAVDEGKSYDEICDEHFETASRINKFIKERVQARDSGKLLNSLKERFESSELRPWQQALKDICLETPCPRKIHWVWEETGNAGKSWMAKYLVATMDACYLSFGKKTDLTYIYATNPKPIVCINLSRTTAPTTDEHERSKKSFLDGLYSLAEDLKDGILVSTKYESRTVLFDVPHVIFFANFEPDYTKWSADRYNVIGL